MAVRSSMAALISRVRSMINDPSGAGQTFSDQDIQDVLDESRQDISYLALKPSPTYTSGSMLFLDYYSDLGGWEDDLVLKQTLSLTVTPSVVEPIVGHFQFAQTTLPPVYIVGKLYDVFRAAADLLDRLSAKWMLSYSVSVDGQTLQRSQAIANIQMLAKSYRLKQRAYTINLLLTDITNSRGKTIEGDLDLAPRDIDYYASGDGR